MSFQQSLAGLAVLIVEDEYLLAQYEARALEDAGARVLGPCRDAADVLRQLDLQTPDCAVVDVNLGGGSDCAHARRLLAQGVPVLFVTGYDISMIPYDLRDWPRLEKPTRASALVGAVRRICGR